MATKTLGELITAVETRLATVGLRTNFLSQSQISPPFAIVPIPEVPDYRAAFGRGLVRLTDWRITILTSSAHDRAGQAKLAEYLSWTGANSVLLAFENEKTLGGYVDDLLIQSSRPLNHEEVGAIGYFGGQILLTVQLPGV